MTLNLVFLCKGEVSYEMSAQHNTAGAFAVLLTVYAKFVNTFLKKENVLTCTVLFIRHLATDLVDH